MMILQKCNNIKIKTAEQGFRSFAFKQEKAGTK